MNNNDSQVLLVGEDEVRLEELRSIFQSIGKECLLMPALEAVKSANDGSQSQTIFLIEDCLDLSTEYQRNQFKQLCQQFLVVVVLQNSGALQVARYFRLGVADVVCPNSGDSEVTKSLSRLEWLAEERSRNRRYREELEKTNHELQESLRLLKQDQLAGLEVQKSLMPEGPLKFGDYVISHSVVPSLYLSGDFVGYDFVLGRYLLFYFADVSGHGASSAFVTVLLRFMISRVIRRHVLQKDFEALSHAPEGLIEHINNQVLATGLGKHLTIFAASLDKETNKLRYVVGAQLPQPVLVANGEASFLAGKGKPAGIFEDASWTVEELTLPERFSLVLLSDGVLDLLPDESLSQKESRLLKYLSSNSENIDRVKESLSIDYVEEPLDDISVLLLTRGL